MCRFVRVSHTARAQQEAVGVLLTPRGRPGLIGQVLKAHARMRGGVQEVFTRVINYSEAATTSPGPSDVVGTDPVWVHGDVEDHPVVRTQAAHATASLDCG